MAACLTGGLDSGSVVLSAARQLAPAPCSPSRGCRAQPAATASKTHCYDESPRARLLAATHPGVDWHTIGDDAGDWGEYDAERWWQENGQPMRAPLNMAWFFPFYRFMRERGANVLMGGEMGNAFYSYDGLARLPELLRSREWRTLVAQTRSLARAEGLTFRKTAQRHVLRPFAPVAVLRYWHRLPAAFWTQYAALHPQLADEPRPAAEPRPGPLPVSPRRTPPFGARPARMADRPCRGHGRVGHAARDFRRGGPHAARRPAGHRILRQPAAGPVPARRRQPLLLAACWPRAARRRKSMPTGRWACSTATGSPA